MNKEYRFGKPDLNDPLTRIAIDNNALLHTMFEILVEMKARLEGNPLDEELEKERDRYSENLARTIDLIKGA